LTVSHYGPRRNIHYDIAKPNDALLGNSSNSRPPKQSGDPLEKLYDSEWLRNVLICIETKSAYFVGFFAAGRQYDYRHPASPTANAFQDLITVDVRQHQIEYDELRRPVLENLESRTACLSNPDVVAFESKIVFDSFREIRIVLDEKYPMRHQPTDAGSCSTGESEARFSAESSGVTI